MARVRPTIVGMMCVIGAMLLGCASRPQGPDGVSSTGLTPTEWASLSQPGISHKLMEMFVGEWDAEVSFWASPGADAQRSSGSSTIRWIFGKRFLQEDFRGEVVGEPFQGMGLMGFDNAARRFKTVWIDSLNTTLAVSQGTYIPDRNLFDLTSEVYDPLVGGMKTVRSTLSVISPNKYSFSMVDTAPNGEQFTSFEIVYKRK